MVSWLLTPSIDLEETLLENPDVILLVDAKNAEGKYQTGCEVTAQYELLERGLLPQFQTAQPAELHALTWACQLSRANSVNIYTDSRSAFGWVPDFGMLWKQRGLLTSDRTQIKTAPQINE